MVREADFVGIAGQMRHVWKGYIMANLIAYYSRKGENYWAGSIKNLEKGNTERVAEFVQEAVGGDLFEIETVKTCDIIRNENLYADSYLEL